jgi:hypothetical protein
MSPIIVAAIVLAVGALLIAGAFVVRKCRRNSSLVKRMIRGLSPPEHTPHPIFGPLRGWGRHWQFDGALSCPGLKVAQVTIAGEGEPSDRHVRNFERLRQEWVEIWPLILAALLENVIGYGMWTPSRRRSRNSSSSYQGN